MITAPKAQHGREDGFKKGKFSYIRKVLPKILNKYRNFNSFFINANN
jgi:hypothetical protein